MSEQSDFSCTDLPPPKDIIYSVPPIHLYPLNYDNDNTLSRGKGIPQKGRKLEVQPSIPTDSSVFPSASGVPRGLGSRRVTTTRRSPR